MLGIITLFIALSTQLGFLIYRIITKDRQTRIKHLIRIAAFIIFALLMAMGVYRFGFRWIGLSILLGILAVFSIIFFIRNPRLEKKYKRTTSILSCASGCFMLTFLILPGILFPQFTPIAPTGSYAVDTTSVTFVDDSRVDPFSKTNEYRKLTVQFWYPDIEKGTYTFPLAVFSHGAFGYRSSNISTFEDLASNGYVVCSIDHSYHAFFSKHTDGSMTFVNTAFLNDAVNITNDVYDKQTTYTKTHEWLSLRTEDIDFVLKKILNNTEGETPEFIEALINEDKIGLFGHSLGGAAAAQIGREWPVVDGVIVIDGTMIGEETGFENGQAILTKKDYPVPLLNLYNDSHYEDAQQSGTAYNNLSASSHGVEAHDIVIRDSGHLNFTDLPLFSPIFARMLGTGEVDSPYCIKTMNHIVLEFFNYTLKDAGGLQLKTEY